MMHVCNGTLDSSELKAQMMCFNDKCCYGWIVMPLCLNRDKARKKKQGTPNDSIDFSSVPVGNTLPCALHHI